MKEHAEITTLLGPENDQGVYFYAKPVRFGSVEKLRAGEFPLSRVTVEKVEIGMYGMVEPPSVIVETGDIRKAVQTGLEQIYNDFVGFVNEY
ncbi:MAG TPA: hypothetical protein VH234_03885 [Candidatus Saccharimonadales bacterium]|jgi:hypothetical protein|nr:hypothetical protein [Candidatus Saccharimonadales bacterium]